MGNRSSRDVWTATVNVVGGQEPTLAAPGILRPTPPGRGEWRGRRAGRIGIGESAAIEPGLVSVGERQGVDSLGGQGRLGDDHALAQGPNDQLGDHVILNERDPWRSTVVADNLGAADTIVTGDRRRVVGAAASDEAAVVEVAEERGVLVGGGCQVFDTPCQVFDTLFDTLTGKRRVSAGTARALWAGNQIRISRAVGGGRPSSRGARGDIDG